MTAPLLYSRLSPPPVPADSGRAFRLSRRWDRTARLLGDEAMERLARARVIVFGGHIDCAAAGQVSAGDFPWAGAKKFLTRHSGECFD